MIDDPSEKYPIKVQKELVRGALKKKSPKVKTLTVNQCVFSYKKAWPPPSLLKMKLNDVIKDCPWFLNHQTSASCDRDVRGSPRQLQDHERIYVFEPPDISAFPQRPKHWIWRNGMKSLKFMVSSIPKTKIYNYIILCMYFDVWCGGYLLFYYPYAMNLLYNNRNSPIYDVSDSLYNFFLPVMCI